MLLGLSHIADALEWPLERAYGSLSAKALLPTAARGIYGHDPDRIHGRTFLSLPFILYFIAVRFPGPPHDGSKSYTWMCGRFFPLHLRGSLCLLPHFAPRYFSRSSSIRCSTSNCFGPPGLLFDGSMDVSRSRHGLPIPIGHHTSELHRSALVIRSRTAGHSNRADSIRAHYSRWRPIHLAVLSIPLYLLYEGS